MLRRALTAVVSVSLLAGAGAAPAGAAVSYSGAFGTEGSRGGQLQQPQGIGFDFMNTLYVADTGNDRIQTFDLSGGFQSAWGWGVSDGSLASQVCTAGCGRGIPGAGAGQLSSPYAVAAFGGGPNGAVVADTGNQRVQLFSASGVWSPDSNALAGLDDPEGVGYGPSGIVAFETGAHQFRLANPGSGWGTPLGSLGSGPGQFAFPGGGGADFIGPNIGIADTDNNRVQEITTSGAFVRSFGSPGSDAGQLMFPSSLAFDNNGQIYVADTLNQRISKFSATGQFLAAWGYGVQTGGATFQVCRSRCVSGLQGSGPGQFDTPGGLTVTTDGRVFVADTNNNRIEVFTQTPEISGPTRLNFGSQGVGVPSAPMTATITNSGDYTMNIQAPAFSGDPDFTLTGPGDQCSTTFLVPGANCTITLRFTPSALGTRTGTMTLSSNAANAPSFPITLVGGGQTASATVDPSALSFATTSPNPSPPQELGVTVTSTSSFASLAVSGATVTGPGAAAYSVSSNSCLGVALAQGQNCRIDVRFNPTSLGSFPATLQVASNAHNSPEPVALTGAAAQGTLAANPSGLTFAPTKTGTGAPRQTVRLTNTGELAIPKVNLAVGGTNSGQFSLIEDCSGRPLGVGQFCNASIGFIPSGGDGTRSATLVATGAASNTPLTLPLAGRVTAPAVGLSPNRLSFGQVKSGAESDPLSVQVSNIGSASLQVGAVSVQGPADNQFDTGAGCAGARLAPGSSCTIAVTFAPTGAKGTRQAQLVVASDAAARTLAVNLTGNVATSAADLAPNTIGFGPVASGTNSAPQQVTIRSTGPVALGVQALGVGGSDPGQFTVSRTCNGDQVVAGTSCQATVKFQPSGSGPQTATLSLLSDAANNVAPIQLSGTADSAAPRARIFGPTVTSRSRPVFRFQASEQTQSFLCSVDGRALRTCTSPYRTPALRPGRHRFAVIAIDLAGNRSLPAVRIFRVR